MIVVQIADLFEWVTVWRLRECGACFASLARTRRTAAFESDQETRNSRSRSADDADRGVFRRSSRLRSGDGLAILCSS